ncbi:prolyl oligopeptidase family serine peptidase [Puniceicoccaceae bacterium K14]|nr:prolyl oligopeptidase family serine peptidase [Puniceicoccaceae bacterium K14]
MLQLTALIALAETNENEPVPELLEPTVKNIFSSERVLDINISRTGRYLAVLKRQDQQEYILLQNLESGEVRRIEPVSNEEISGGITFAGTDGHLFYTQHKKLRNTSLVYNIESRKIKGAPDIHDFWDTNAEQAILVSSNPMGYPAIRHHNFETNRSKLVQTLPENAIAIFYESYSGLAKVVITAARLESGRSAKREKRARERTHVLDENNKWQPIPFFDNAILGYQNVYDTKDPVGLSPDGKTLYFSKLNSYGTRGLYTFNLDTMEEEHEVLVDPRFDVIPVDSNNENVEVVRFSTKDDRLLGIRANGTYDKTIWVDSLFSSVQKIVDETLPRRNLNRIILWTQDETKFIVNSYSDVNPGIYYLFDSEKGTINSLEERLPEVDNDLLTQNMILNIPLRDGSEMLAYLRLPRGVEKSEDLSCIVSLPYFFERRFNWNEIDLVDHAYAGSGFGYLRLNVTGTPGFGRSHFEKGYKEGGISILENVEDALDYLIKKKIIRPDRIALEGRGYSSFYTLAAASRRPNFYQGIILHDPIAGLKEYFMDRVQWEKKLKRWSFLEEINKSMASEPSLKLKSVIDGVEVPVAIFGLKSRVGRHSSEEYANELYRALKRRKRDVELYKFSDPIEKNVEGVIHEYETAIEFLQKQMGEPEINEPN